MTTHEQDARFYQDTLIDILESIRADILTEKNQNKISGDFGKGCDLAYSVSLHHIDKRLDKAKEIKRIQEHG